MKRIILFISLISLVWATTSNAVVWKHVISTAINDHPKLELVVFITDMSPEGQKEKEMFIKAVKNTSIKNKFIIMENWKLFDIDAYLSTLKTDGSFVLIVAEFTRDNTGQIIQLDCGPCYLKKFDLPVYSEEYTSKGRRKIPLFVGW